MTNVFLTKEERQKLVETIQKRLSSDEIIINLFKIELVAGGNRSVVLTTKCLYFYQKTSLKKTIPAIQILNLTLSFSGMMLAIHTLTGSIMFFCFELAKLLKNILFLRQKERYELTCELFLANEELFAQQQKSFWSKILKRSNKKPEDQLLREIIQVQSSSCVLEISKKLYSFDEKISILYLSGQMGFIFKPQNYRLQVMEDGQQLFIQQHISLRKRKIIKQQNLKPYLQKTKRTDYTQQIHFILESEFHFQIISQYYEGSQTGQQLINKYYEWEQKDLKTISHKLICLIENLQIILHSLSPQCILKTKQGFKIALPLCLLYKNMKMNYYAPEQMMKQNIQIKKVNRWKIGMLLYEIAYYCLPFPLEYIAYCAKKNIKPVLSFPHNRYPGFQKFINVLIQRQKNIDIEINLWIIK